jgi:hypothetical protein
VREVKVKGQNFTFEVYSESGVIKSCKKKNNSLVEGHHDNFIIAAESKQDMDNWIAATQSNIASNPLFEMVKKRKEESQITRGRMATSSEKPLDFQEFHDACMMCSMCYKSPNVIKVKMLQLT